MSNFVIGTDNFKKDVRNHDKCEIHAFKAKPFVEAKSKIPGTSEAEKMLWSGKILCGPVNYLVSWTTCPIGIFA